MLRRVKNYPRGSNFPIPPLVLIRLNLSIPKPLELTTYFLMVVCPNCSHTNPQGALNCEACYTALPATKACPSCGTSIQIDATFCGQCGYNLKVEAPAASTEPVTLPPATSQAAPLPATVLSVSQSVPTIVAVVPEPLGSVPDPVVELAQTILPPEVSATEVASPVVVEPEPVVPAPAPVATQLQQSGYHLVHLQTGKILELAPHLSTIYLGKPNEQSPPDIDISGLPCAEVVSRVHASIRVEGDSYYVEDLGSANGTYINHNGLAKGNRHLLRVGDRISLGKGDLVTFIFQST